jgi:hypothetical protein
MLGEHFGISLNRTTKAKSDCDYRMLRKRESDGTTIVSLHNCDETKSAGDTVPTPSSEVTQTYIVPVPIGMLPAHPGPVTYDVISNIASPDAPSWAESHIDLVAHDPTPPSQVSIVNPLPDCTELQLMFVSLPPAITTPRTTLQAYEATNISNDACAVAGVPHIRTELGAMWPCPNCGNNLFAARPNGRIDLKQGQSAHFLVGTEFHSEDGLYGSECQPIKSVDFELPKWNRSLALPYAGGACGTLDVSAWREGKFDSDPLNIQWAKTHPASSDPISVIPSDCDISELLSRGRPVVISTEKDLSFGLSLEHHEFKPAETIKLHIWVDNAGSTPVGVMTCKGLDSFKANGFDLYDAYGHRVLRRSEAKRQQQCTTDAGHAKRELGRVCSRNYPINIPAHTCMNGDGSDFTTSLTADYDLPPGQYTARARLGEPADLCNPQQEQPVRAASGEDLIFSVLQP